MLNQYTNASPLYDIPRLTENDVNVHIGETGDIAWVEVYGEYIRTRGRLIDDAWVTHYPTIGETTYATLEAFKKDFIIRYNRDVREFRTSGDEKRLLENDLERFGDNLSKHGRRAIVDRLHIVRDDHDQDRRILYHHRVQPSLHHPYGKLDLDPKYFTMKTKNNAGYGTMRLFYKNLPVERFFTRSHTPLTLSFTSGPKALQAVRLTGANHGTILEHLIENLVDARGQALHILDGRTTDEHLYQPLLDLVLEQANVFEEKRQIRNTKARERARAQKAAASNEPPTPKGE